MVNKRDNRPGQANTWDGLWTTEAPLNLKDNALLKADDVLFRYPTLIEQRQGLREYQQNPTTYKPVAMNLKTVTVNGQNEDKIITTLLDTTRNAFFLADESDNGQLDATKNYWGNTLVNRPNITPGDVGGMGMGEPRFKNGIYMTHMGPGRLLDTPQLMGVTSAYTGALVQSKPLGVQSCVDTKISFTVYNQTVTATDHGAAYIQPGQIHTVAGQSVVRVGNNYGIPSNTAYATAPVMPTLNGNVTLVTTGQYKLTMTGPYTNIAVGGVLKVTGTDKDSWVGSFNIQALDTANNTMTVINTNPNVDVGTVAFNTYGFAMGIHMETTLSKEYFWGDNFSFPAVAGKRPADRWGSESVNWFFKEGSVEFYRTYVAQSTPEVGANDPGLEFYKVDSQSINGLNYGTFTTDSARFDTALGDPLYCNETLGGVGVQNYTPPQAKIHASFKSFEFYANTVERSIFTATIPAIFGTDIFIRVTPNCNAQGATEAMVLHIGQTELDLNDGLEAYCRSICAKINANQDVPLNALYISTFSATPGQIELSALSYAASKIEVLFTTAGSGIVNSVQTSVEPTLVTIDLSQYQNSITPQSYKTSLNGTYPVVSGMGYVISPEIKTNRVYYSKIQQPGSVPLANTFDLPDNVVIMGMETTTNGLFVITDSGLWQVTGPSGATDPWTPKEYDLSARCWSQGSINYLGDQVYFLTDQGLQVYGNGDILSHQVTDQVLPVRIAVKRINTFWDYNSKGEPWLSSVVDPFNQEYLITVPNLNDYTKNKMLRYNVNNSAWSQMGRNVSCGLFSTKDDANRMMFADADLSQLLIERDDNDILQFSDESFELWFPGLEPVVALADGTFRYYGFINQSGPVCAVAKVNDFIIGITVKPGTTQVQNIEACRILSYKVVSRGGLNVYEIILDNEIPTASDNVDVQFVRAFQANIGLNTFKGTDPTVLKRWSMIHINLQGSVREIDLDLHTDDKRLAFTNKLTTINPEDGWGNHPWGNFAWGDETLDAQPELVTYVPQGYNLGTLFQMNLVNRGFNQDLKLQRVTIDYADTSNRSRQ